MESFDKIGNIKHPGTPEEGGGELICQVFKRTLSGLEIKSGVNEAKCCFEVYSINAFKSFDVIMEFRPIIMKLRNKISPKKAFSLSLSLSLCSF